MKRIVAILLTLALLLPSIERVNDTLLPWGMACIDEAPADTSATVKQSPPAAQQSITLTATKIRRTPPIRVKVLRLFRVKPSIHSEAARHSELRSGDTSAMRI